MGKYVLTRTMFEEARGWLLLDATIAIAAPVHIIQGRDDATVPWRHQVELIERLTAGNVHLDLIVGGDHRLASADNLRHLVEVVARNR